MHPILFSLANYDFRISPSITILSALIAFFYLRHYRSYAGLSLEALWMLALWLIVSAFAGAMALAWLLHGWNWFGSFYGAFWTGVLAAYLFCRIYNVNFPRVADLLGGMAPLALSIKRWGCFLQGCCHGLPTDRPWGIVFTDSRSQVGPSYLGMALHPTQIYESFAAGMIFLFVHLFVFQRIRKGRFKPGSAFVASVMAYSLFRFAIEPLRWHDLDLPYLAGLNSSQLLAAASVLTVLLFHYYWKKALKQA